MMFGNAICIVPVSVKVILRQNLLAVERKCTMKRGQVTTTIKDSQQHPGNVSDAHTQ